MIRLEAALRDHGIDLTRDEFRELVADVARQVAPGWTDERITCNPTVALQVCEQVRRVVDGQQLPEEVILRALTNIRRAVARAG